LRRADAGKPALPTVPRPRPGGEVRRITTRFLTCDATLTLPVQRGLSTIRYRLSNGLVCHYQWLCPSSHFLPANGGRPGSRDHRHRSPGGNRGNHSRGRRARYSVRVHAYGAAGNAIGRTDERRDIQLNVVPALEWRTGATSCAGPPGRPRVGARSQRPFTVAAFTTGPLIVEATD
jgi:hypothetical protein